MTGTTIDIDPRVALQEAQAEIGFLRNRILLLSQALADTKAQIQPQKKEPE